MITNYFTESIYVFSILILIIYIFLVLTFLILLNTFDVRFIKNLNDLKKFGTLFPFNLFFIVIILSFAGVPPLFGFSIKLILFLFVINGTAIFYIILLTLFNFFTLYFYVQNVRYVINNSKNNYYVYSNYFAHISDISIFLLLIAFGVNILGILYLTDFLSFIMSFSI
jgi:NADH-quinone oxidoreductase subunit N